MNSTKAESPEGALDRVCRTKTPARLSDKDIAILRDHAIQLRRANDTLRADNEILRVAVEERRLENIKAREDYENLEHHLRRESKVNREQEAKIRDLEAELRGNMGSDEWQQMLLNKAAAAAGAEGHRQDLAHLESQIEQLLDQKRMSRVLVLDWTNRLRDMRAKAQRVRDAWGRWQELKVRSRPKKISSHALPSSDIFTNCLSGDLSDLADRYSTRLGKAGCWRTSLSRRGAPTPRGATNSPK